MLRSILISPLRVYLVLASLAGLGIYAGTTLPISLFPQTTQPNIAVGIKYGSMSPQEFRRIYGKAVEGELRRLKTPLLHTEKVETTYGSQSFRAEVRFNWGAQADQAYRETMNVFFSATNSLPEEIRRTRWISNNNGNSSGGFFAMSFYSRKRNLSQLHDLLSPIVEPRLNQIEAAESVSLWNPERSSIEIMLKPAMISALNVTGEHIQAAVQSSLRSQNAGSISNGTRSDKVSLEPQVASFDDLKRLMIPLPRSYSNPDQDDSLFNSSGAMALGELATVRESLGSEFSQSFKTSGVSSLILFASAKSGANVKQMADQITEAINEIILTLPADIEYRVLVDPSEFISSAIFNVFHEVLMAAGLASILLFLFIGRLRNVITAAIEIPLSIALALILMWLFNININLLSLAGLALAAGMNVDASVVVMENIFRHLDAMKGEGLDRNAKIALVVRAVSEVKMPVVASTISSLVVFVPFLFTTGISQAILGDLAKAVIFSHGFSAIIALILVPTVRLHLMSKFSDSDKKQAPLDLWLRILESWYHRLLDALLRNVKWSAPIAFLAIMAAGVFTQNLLSKLPKEVMGKPESDWIYLGINSEKFSSKRQMEGHVEELQRQKLSTLDSDIKYTFDQIFGANNASILLKIRDKKRLDIVKNQLEKLVPEIAGTHYNIGQWSPGELNIPNPPEFRYNIIGGDPHKRRIAARDLKQLLDSERVFKKTSSSPNVDTSLSWNLRPNQLQWALISRSFGITPSAVAERLRATAEPQFIGEIIDQGRSKSISLLYPENMFKSVSELEAFPVQVGERLVPLKALMAVSPEEMSDTIYAEDGADLHVVYARLKEENVPQREAIKKRLDDKIQAWQAQRIPQLGLQGIAVNSQDPDIELTRSIDQLKIAFAISLVLILMTMVFQFGNLIEAFIVTVAVPLGLIGAISSLSLFNSTLSVNAVLGMILLNGIAVANSIMLVEMGVRNFRGGLSSREAIIGAATRRLRPILITSATTVLGMLPIAFGYGEGGRVLQPLGIAVTGGLWFSMSFTLVLVPVFHYLDLRRHERQLVSKDRTRVLQASIAPMILLLALAVTMTFTKVAKAASTNLSEFNYLQALDQIVGKDDKLKSQILADQAALVGKKSLSYLFYPEVNANVTRQDSRTFGRNNRVQSGVAAGISSGVNILSFGRGRADRSIYQLLEQKLQYQNLSYYLEAEARAMEKLGSWLAAHKQRAVIAKMSQIRQSLLNVGQKQFSRGMLSEQDLHKLSFDLTAQEFRLNQAEIEVKNTYAELADANLLLPDQPDSTPWLLQSSLNSLAQNFEKSIKSDGQVILSHNPDVKVRSTNLEQLKEQEQRLRSEAFPSLDLQASLNKNITGPQESEGLNGSVALVLSLPLTGKTLSQSYQRQAALNRLAALAEDQDTMRAITIKLVGLYRDFSQRSQSIAVREQLVRSAQQLYRDAQERFDRGLITVNDLAQDEDRLYATELALISDWLEIHRQVTELCHGLGQTLRHCV